MTTYLGKSCILFAVSAFRKMSSIYVFSYFPFGFEGRIWDLIVSVSDHCLSFYFIILSVYNKLIAYYLKYENWIMKSLLGASYNKSHGPSCNSNTFYSHKL